jgi:transposase
MRTSDIAEKLQLSPSVVAGIARRQKIDLPPKRPGPTPITLRRAGIIRELAPQGLSAQEIAEELARREGRIVTKNAALGVCTRQKIQLTKKPGGHIPGRKRDRRLSQRKREQALECRT